MLTQIDKQGGRVSEKIIDRPELDSLGQYEFGWSDSDEAGASARRGIKKK